MNAGLSHTLDSLFGPPSELINISLLELSSSLEENTYNSEVFDLELVNECSTSEINKTLRDTWTNPILSAHLIKDHDHTVSTLHALKQNPEKPARKAHLPDPHTLPVAATALQRDLDTVALSSFRYLRGTDIQKQNLIHLVRLKTDAVMFMRSPKNSDKNVLRNVRLAPDGEPLSRKQEITITISFYNKIPWGPSYVTRSSQHVFVSSQTLQDVYDAIICGTKQLPREADMPTAESGGVLCIEGIAYGSGSITSDHITLVELLSNKKPGSVCTSPTSQGETALGSLSLRINEPYWMVHHGNCEHFIVVNQLRHAHPADPCTGYPLTLQITPPTIDLCRACSKIPASWSIVGDVRLGESPCLLCGPCWRSMGESKDEGVMILPLSEYTYL